MTVETGRLEPEGVRGMFDRIAPFYDAMNRVMTVGLDRRWRRLTAEAVVSSGDKVLASASTLEKDVRTQLKNGGNRKAAEIVGQRIAAKAKEKGIAQVAFDRAGYRYHGRVKALADAARAGGLKF